jgi:hypothetical protein
MQPEPMQTGQHVTPTIKLVRPLEDQGAMGSVWVAEHLALNTRVAVKFMAPGYADDERSVLRFRQEAQAGLLVAIAARHVVAGHPGALPRVEAGWHVGEG